MNIVDIEKPQGVIVQYGGQTPLKLVNDLYKFGVPIIGTSSKSIDAAEDREKFKNILTFFSLQIVQLEIKHKLLKRQKKLAIQS